jgi:predicted ATPase
MSIPESVIDLVGRHAGRYLNPVIEKITPPVTAWEWLRTVWTEAWTQLRESEREEMRSTIKMIESEIFGAAIEALKGRETRLADTARYEKRSLPECFNKASNYLLTTFPDHIRYLGPLRDSPKSLYPLSDAVFPFEVGLKGEHTAAVLKSYEDKRVEYLPSKLFCATSLNFDANRDKARVPLKLAVEDWLDYLGIAKSLFVTERGTLGIELKIVTSNLSQAQDLTQIGIGVSQVLPIVVMCLLAPPGATILLEQPELHLHPKLQADLADFILSMTMLGKQCVAETHGEHLINRIRWRIAATKEKELEKNIRIFFLEKVGGESRCRAIQVNRFGAIEEWPKDFFDQSQVEVARILAAAMDKMEEESRDEAPDSGL